MTSLHQSHLNVGDKCCRESTSPCIKLRKRSNLVEGNVAQAVEVLVPIYRIIEIVTQGKTNPDLVWFFSLLVVQLSDRNHLLILADSS